MAKLGLILANFSAAKYGVDPERSPAAPSRSIRAELASLVEHAMRLRSLMGFVPRRYDPAVIEALALAWSKPRASRAMSTGSGSATPGMPTTWPTRP